MTGHVQTDGRRRRNEKRDVSIFSKGRFRFEKGTKSHEKKGRRDVSILRRGRKAMRKRDGGMVSILSGGGKKGRRDVSSLREGRRWNYERPRFEMADGKRDITIKG